MRKTEVGGASLRFRETARRHAGFTCRLGAGSQARPHRASAHVLQSMSTSRLASSSPLGNAHTSPASGSVCGKIAPVWGQMGRGVKMAAELCVGVGWGRKPLTLPRPMGVGVISRMSERHVCKLKGRRASRRQVSEVFERTACWLTPLCHQHSGERPGVVFYVPRGRGHPQGEEGGRSGRGG